MKYDLTASLQYELYVYDMPALDWTFCFFTVNEFKERIRTLSKEDYFISFVLTDREALIEEIDELLKTAECEAKKEGWDGEHRAEPLIFALPAGPVYNMIPGSFAGIDGEQYETEHGTVLFGIVIKQHNDGITFVYSPVKLEHLEEKDR